jgi:hypothetical protein
MNTKNFKVCLIRKVKHSTFKLKKPYLKGSQIF